MREFLLMLAVVCAVPTIGTRPAAARDIGGDAFAQPWDNTSWTVSASSVFLHRSKARPETLAENGTTNAELANVADFDLGWAAGPQLELSRRFQCGWGVSLRYFQVDGWNAERTLHDPGNLRVPLVSADPADYFDSAFARYASRLYSTEVNLHRQCGERLSLLAGFRWTELHEKVAAGAYSPTLEGVFDIGTSNHLYGFQMGAEAALWQRGRWQLDGFLKAGIYSNCMRFSVAGHGTYFDIEGAASKSRPSLLGELGLTARCRLTRNWSVFGGYQVMWLEGVALAGDAVAALRQNSGEMLENGTAFYHGAVAGLECRW